MSEKRKFEELADPDYPQNVKKVKTTGEDPPQLSREERLNKIRAIVKREFQRELTAKEQEIMEIDNRIQLARKLLHRVRYAVVSHYYNKKGMELPDQEAQACVESLNLKSTAPPASESGQRAIHPALKSILGKKTVDYDEILKARPTREAAKTAKTSIKEKLRTKKEEKRLQRALNGAVNTVICHDTTPKVPRHVEPNKVEKEIPQLNAARGRNQTKCLIAVGNTSKYVGDEKFANGVTHKWLVYVKTKTPVPIEKIVTKVRFFLHPSYRPNDIVDVCEPPFQLSRRGWGEFPIRLQLYFEASLQQKPVQLVHNLVLDKTLTGLQTMGAETLVEMWLRTDHLQIPHDSKNTDSTFTDLPTTEDETSQHSEDNPIDHIDDKLMELLNRIENQTSKSLCEEGEKIEPTISVAANSIETDFMVNDGLALQENHNIHGDETNPNLASTLILPEVVNQLEVGKSIDAMPACSIDASSLEGPSVTSQAVSLKSEPEFEQDVCQTTSVAVKHEPPNPAVTPQVAEIDSLENKLCLNQSVCALPITEPAKSVECTQLNPTSSPRTTTLAKPSVNIITKISSISKDPKDPTKPTIITPASSISNKPQIFQKRIVKCIDKQGNVKLVEMLVKSADSQNGQIGRVMLTPQTQTATGPKTIIISNGQKGLAKPLVFKIAPANSVNSVKPTPAISQPNTTIAPVKDTYPVKAPTTSASPLITSGLKVLATKENQSNLSSALPKSALNSTNKNQVLVKNGKMYIIDPLQAKIKQQTKKQESLLKPQVSLLKPIVKNDNLNNCIRNDAKSVFNHTSIATDHDYTSFLGKSPTPNKVTIHRSSLSQQPQQLLHKQKSSIVTVNSPNNSRINVIVTKLDDDEEDDDGDQEIRLNMKTPVMQKSTALMQKPRRDYRSELEMIFARTSPVSVRQAVEFLLKQLPLIDAKASSTDYSSSFPFIVKSQSVFDRLITPKLKANEWLRAKYILQLLQKHPHLNTSKFWTTKEIVLFARLHAYTPVINYKIGKEFNDNNRTTDRTLKDLVKKEIKREKYDIQTTTLVHGTYDWINDIRQKINRELLVSEEIINVDGNDDESCDKRLNKEQDSGSPLKNAAGKYFHPLDSSLETEASFVNDACQQIGIRLKPEEIVTNVLHPSAQLVLIQCFKSFMNDLLRRAAACRPDVDISSTLVENVIRPEDIKNAILSRPQWDFLTNNGLGVAKPKEQKD